MRTHSYFVRVRPTQLYFQTRGWPSLDSAVNAFISEMADGTFLPLATTDEGNHDLELRIQHDKMSKRTRTPEC